jgi:hypothetical protein
MHLPTLYDSFLNHSFNEFSVATCCWGNVLSKDELQLELLWGQEAKENNQLVISRVTIPPSHQLCPGVIEEFNEDDSK